MKALIVDSSKVVLHLLWGLFSRVGMDVSSARSGAEAMKVLEREQVDLVCFSFELGDMDGIEFVVGIRAAGLLRHQPALMFASTHDKYKVTRALESGVTECFSKNKLKHFEQFIEKFASGQRLRIEGSVLLIEDSKSMAMFYRHVLEHMGLHIDHCLTAEDAIERLGKKHFDLVITDYILSGAESGLSVIRAVRDMPGKKSQTPILVISAFDDVARKVEIIRNGANDFVSKPVSPEELEVRVANLITTRKLMTRLELQHETMKDMAMHDSLTGLKNRYYLDEISTDMIGDARANSQPLILMVLDIDHFKLINDSHGHRIGDLVLKKIAEILQGFCRNDDLMARVGGEEFVAMINGISLSEATVRAEVLRGKIESAMPCGLTVTVSIGLASLVIDDSYDDLFRRADGNLYRAKTEGRNRVIASTMHAAGYTCEAYQ